MPAKIINENRPSGAYVNPLDDWFGGKIYWLSNSIRVYIFLSGIDIDHISLYL